MTENEKCRRRLRELALALSSGEASEEQEAEFCSLVLHDADARAYAVSLLHQFAALEAEGCCSPALAGSDLSTIESGLGTVENPTDSDGARSHSTQPGPLPCNLKNIQLEDGHSCESRSDRVPVPLDSPRTNSDKATAWLDDQVKGWIPLAAAFLVGVAFTYMVSRSFRSGDSSRDSTASTINGPNSPNRETFVARLVSNSGTIWNTSDGQRLESGDEVRPMETVTLLDGIAEFVFEEGATVSLEGPAAINVDADGAPVLQYGGMMAHLPWGHRDSHIKTALGSILLDGDDVVGIQCHGGDIQVYVFHGEVVITSADSKEEPILVSVGNAKWLGIGPSGKRRTYTYQGIDPQLFADRFALNSDQLETPPPYAQMIQDARPVGYWRFEQAVGSMALNEISGSPPLRIGGGATIVPQGKNHVMEFGFGAKSGYLIAERSIDELAGKDYTVEAWVKPSHTHWGTILALVRRRTSVREVEGHGFMLEIGGSWARDPASSNSFRFLHRSPPSSSSREGTSCYSVNDYKVRKWQHVAAVKSGDKMRLYVNGHRSATTTDNSRMADDLTLVVGQLFSFESVRPFIGQLDELAIYDHALTNDQIALRYQVVRKGQAD